MNIEETIIKTCSEKAECYLIRYKLLQRQELTFSMVEGQLYQIVKAIHQPYINPIHQSIHLRLFLKFKLTCTVKPDNKTYDQLINLHL